MAEISTEQVEALLKEVNDRYLEKDIVTLNQVKAIDINDGKVFVRVQQGYPAGSYRDELATAHNGILYQPEIGRIHVLSVRVVDGVRHGVKDTHHPLLQCSGTILRWQDDQPLL